MEQEIKIIKQKRKTTGIYILADCTVEIRCPVWMHTGQALAFAQTKQAWIQKKIMEKQQEKKSRDAFVFTWGSMAPYLGHEYPVWPSEEPGFDGGAFYVLPQEGIKEGMIGIYRQKAKEILPVKAQGFSKQMGCTFPSVKITSARTKWGSCSSRGNINFSWRLMQAPEPAVDYVVIHELAHLFHYDHGADFWNLVCRFCPDYQEQKQALRRVERRIMVEAW